MPVNQPTQYIQRGPRNYVNISGAILTPFAQGLGEVASQGVKDMLGFSTPAEDYQRQLTATMEDSRMRNADKDWQERLAQADGGQYANNPDAQKQWAMDRYGWDEERAGRWANSSAHDSVEAMRMRNASQAQFADNRLDPMPGAKTAQTPGINPAPAAPFPSPSVQASPTPTAPTQPQGPPAAAETSQEVQKAQSRAAGALDTQSMPTLPTVTPSAPPSPTSLPGQTPGSAPTSSAPAPVDTQQLRKELQAYQVRQAANLSLYRQVAKAGINGQIDDRQMAVATQLANTNVRELTQLMQTAAPALGTDWVDNNGDPIQGNVLLDGLAATRLQQLTSGPAEALEAFKKSSPGVFNSMQQAANRFNARLSNMSFANAAALSKAIEPIAKSNLVSPEAHLTYLNAQANRAQDREQFNANLGLKKAELSMRERELASSIGLQQVQTEQARFNLGMLQRYAPQKEEMYLKSAQAELDKVNASLGVATTQLEKERLATGMAAFESLMDIQAKSENAFFQRHERTMAALGQEGLKALQEISRVESEWGDTNAIQYQNKLKAARGQIKDPQVEAWILQNVPDKSPDSWVRDADPSNKFDYWFRKQPGNQAYDTYRTNLLRARGMADSIQVKIQKAAEEQPASVVSPGMLNDARSMAQRTIQERLVPGLRLQAKSLLKSTDSTQWQSLMADDPAVVNKIVGEFTGSAAGLMPSTTWNEKDSRSLLELAGTTLRDGHGVPVSPEKLGATPIPVRDKNGRVSQVALRDIYKNKFPAFWNAYNKLVTELK